ncbi:TetR/AcrR family transcriptional regulator [Luteococcus peritonei]|uniref:TetR/AcrR family transcriptional regulator n=1 Tax=Luteococcus peritonei TaxID=88874 RepID=A0ABW4RTN7_9ACTN
MTRMTLAERRQKLIAAALSVVARNGVAAATTRAIAAEAGMPLASFHYAFESHQALMTQAYLQLVTEELERESKHALQPGSESEVVGQVLSAHLADLMERRPQHQAVFEMADHLLRTGDQAEVPAQWRTERVRAMAKRLEEAGVNRPQEAAEATVTVLEGLTQSLVTTGDAAAARRAIDYWAGMRAAS